MQFTSPSPIPELRNLILDQYVGRVRLKASREKVKKLGERMHKMYDVVCYPSLFICFFAPLSLFPNLSTS